MTAKQLNLDGRGPDPPRDRPVQGKDMTRLMDRLVLQMEQVGVPIPPTRLNAARQRRDPDDRKGKPRPRAR